MLTTLDGKDFVEKLELFEKITQSPELEGELRNNSDYIRIKRAFEAQINTETSRLK